MFERELTLEIGNPLRLVLKLFAKPFILLAQPIDFLRPAIARRRLAHCVAIISSALAPSTRATKSLQKLQVQNRAKGHRAELLPSHREGGREV